MLFQQSKFPSCLKIEENWHPCVWKSASFEGFFFIPCSCQLLLPLLHSTSKEMIERKLPVTDLIVTNLICCWTRRKSVNWHAQISAWNLLKSCHVLKTIFLILWKSVLPFRKWPWNQDEEEQIHLENLVLTRAWVPGCFWNCQRSSCESFFFSYWNTVKHVFW